MFEVDGFVKDGNNNVGRVFHIDSKGNVGVTFHSHPLADDEWLALFFNPRGELFNKDSPENVKPITEEEAYERHPQLRRLGKGRRAFSQVAETYRRGYSTLYR